MSAIAPAETGSKRRKALDAELNLVPFFDLLSCLLSLLLITAVWTPITAIHAQAPGSEPAAPLSDDRHRAIPFRVTMTLGGFTVLEGGVPKTIPKPAEASAITGERSSRN